MAGPSPVTAVPWIGRGKRGSPKYRILRHLRTLLADLTTPDDELIPYLDEAASMWKDGATLDTVIAELPMKEWGFIAYGAASLRGGSSMAVGQWDRWLELRREP